LRFINIVSLQKGIYMLPRYKDIVDLLKKGSTIEAQEKIMSLREGALELQEENQELKEKINDLEKQLHKADDWEAEKNRYTLASPWRGSGQVYALKESNSNGEVPHFLCTDCFNNSNKVILNPSTKLKSVVMECPSCKSGVDTSFRVIGPAKYAEEYAKEG
jgi:hypothetical protein